MEGNHKFWTMKDGREIPIVLMQTSHIHHCIAKIVHSKKGWRFEYLPRLRAELEYRRHRQIVKANNGEPWP